MRKSIFTAVLVVLAVTAATVTSVRTASAHPPPFFWMSDTSGTSFAGVEMLIGTSNTPIVDTTMVGFGLGGNFAVTDNISILARLPLGFVAFNVPAPGSDDSAFALGNMNVGVQVHSAPDHHNRTRFGGALKFYAPTASDSNTAGTAASALAGLHFVDVGRYLPHTTTARLQGDVRLAAETIFFQGELNLDLHFRDNSQDDLTLLVLGLGLGAMLTPEFALLLEFSGWSDILEDSDGENFIEALDFGLRYHNPRFMFGARLYWPLDDDYRDSDMLGVGLDFAARF